MNESDSMMDKWRKVPTEPVLSEKAKSYIEQVNRSRAEAEQAGVGALEAELAFLNKTRECGVLLEDAKGTLSPNQWKLAQSSFEFTERQVQGLLDFARRFPEPITDAREAVRSLKDAQLALGFTDYAEGHGPQKLHEYNFAIVLTKRATDLVAEIRKAETRAPISEWSPSYAAQYCAMVSKPRDEINRSFELAKARAALNR